MTKVIIPSNPKKVLELAQNILDKHLADGESSPITLVVPEDMQQTITNGLQLHKEADTMEKAVEKKYVERDVFVKEADKMIKRARDILKSVYNDNLKKLGDHGFEVNE